MREGYVSVEWKAKFGPSGSAAGRTRSDNRSGGGIPRPPAFHPSMANVFEQKVRALARALEHEDLEQRESARSTMRGFIDRIVIPPGDALLQVVGDLGSMLTAASGRDGSALAAVGNGGCGGGI